MAKSESTAVNALIDMVQSGSPVAGASDDLFAAPPSLTNTIPPLPPMRAPSGTSQLDVKSGQVRMSTAPPSRGTSVPPLPQPKGAKAPPPPVRASSPGPRVSQPMPAQKSAPSRTSQPMPAQRRTSQQMPAQARRTATDDVITGKVNGDPITNKVTPPRRAPSPTPDAVVAKKRAGSPGPEALLGRKRAPSPSPEMLGAAPRPAAPRTSQQFPAARAQGTVPPPTSSRPAPAPRATQRTTPPSTTPVAAPFDAPHPLLAEAEQYRNSTIDQTGDVVNAENWFEASRAVEKIDETWIGTKPAPRRNAPGASVKKAIVPLFALAVVGFGVGYVVFHTATKKHPTAARPATTHVAAPAPTAAATPAIPSPESANAATATAGGTQPEPPAPSAAPSVGPADPNVPSHPNANDVKVVDHAAAETPAAAPAPAPVPAPVAAPAAAPVPAAAVKSVGEAAPQVQEVQTAHGTVKLVDVRIDSTPAGATVMLVDNGKTTFLGTTPVAASVDPARSYDVVLTLEGRPTQMAHLDPTKTQKLDVTLGKTAKAAPAVKTAAAPKAETPAPRKATKTKHVAASAPAGGLADPGFDAPAEPKAEPKADAGGNGTLMVSSKPPCEIFIDGNDSGLKTPQRSMSLPAGTHKVTFSNPDENITKTVTVKITADQTTKLIQNLMGE
jgi:hypothetical protein